MSIDDFGTGYSCLACLKRFKVDKIKIDRSFIVKLLTDEGDHAIVQVMIQTARSLNFKTIAEGVEDADLRARLPLMGCDEAQGYHYAILPAGDWTGWSPNEDWFWRHRPGGIAPLAAPSRPGPGPHGDHQPRGMRT